MARSSELVTERALAATCDRADIVIADRGLPRSCKPRWIKADRRMLRDTGGLAISLKQPKIRTVAQGQGEHGWWRRAEQYRTATAQGQGMAASKAPTLPKTPQ
jgi:competence protein ComEC